MPETRKRSGLLFVAVFVGHVLLKAAQVNTASGGRVVEAGTFGVFSEVQRVTWTSVAFVRDTWQSYVALRDLHGENERLRDEIVQLQVRLQEQRDAVQESQRLEELLDLRRNLPLTTVAARVIAGEASPAFRSITIDRGRRDGLGRDMAAIAPVGVVGRLVRVGERASAVQILIDRAAAVGALIERSRASGVVVGVAGDPPLQMQYVSDVADVIVGDTLVTSGVDGIYPKGFVIGQVESIERGASERQIRVRPAVDFTRLEEVLVVVPPPAKDAP